ncbi:MAG: ABC transporter permease [Peptococcaceae bacterium]|nr:ABC transporter permease [Peptococcaceae bacterium]
MSVLTRLSGIIYAEILSLLRNRTQAFIFLAMPFVIFLFLAGIYHEPVINHIPTVILDLDHSQKSREIINAYAANPVLEIKGLVSNRNDMESLLKAEDARVGIIIPENFESAMTRGEAVGIMTVIDGSNMVFTNTSGSAVAEVASRLAAELKVNLISSKGLLTEKAERIIRAVQFTVSSRYNPTYNYAFFLLFGLGINILQQTCLLGISTSLSGEKSQNTWWHYGFNNCSGVLILPGKLLPYLLIALLQFALLMLLGSQWLGLPFRGSLLLLFLSTIIFLVAVTSFGLMVSALTSPVNSIRYTMVMAMPSFVFSGYTWPAEAMNPLAKAIGQCLPLTWYLKSFQAISMKGAGWEIVWPYLACLTVMAAVFLAIALYLVNKLNRSVYDGG